MLARMLPKPVAILNIGGIANVTFVGESVESLIAFDTGPGNALIDDWVRKHHAGQFDADGQIAARGVVDESRVERALSHPFFAQQPPKSLDRGDFDLSLVQDLSLEDGCATLTAITAEAIVAGVGWLPSAPAQWVLCGGGRLNKSLVDMLRNRLLARYQHTKVAHCEEYGWNGDAVEAQVCCLFL